MALSTKQLLTLNTLMYMVEDPFPQVLDYPGRTVADLISSVDPGQIDPAAEYDCMITGGEWRNLLQMIRLDPTLLSLHIAATHIDRGEGGGGGRSAVFLSPTTADAVVVFKGTQSPEEWADNFAGFNLSDTPQQRNALNWYRRVYTQLGLNRFRVTVTGHSKGGNKAKYIGVLEDTVQQCVAFDGQGFSELFIQKYAPQIARRQGLIESHSAEYDFVNFLFNNVGSAYFYTASSLEGAGFGRNHSPSAMMHFTPSGGFEMIPAPGGQAEGIRAVGRFSDSFFRSLSPDQRDSSYHTVEALRAAAFSMGGGEKKDLINVFLPLVSDPAHTDDLAYLLAYTIKYTQCDPTFIPQLRALLTKFGLEDITRYILLVDGILNLNIDTPIGPLTFQGIMDELSRGSKSLSPGLLDLLLFWVSQKGIHLTPYQLQELLGILPQVNDYLATIRPEVCASSPPVTSSDALGLNRLSQSLEFLGTMMGGSPMGSSQTPPTKLRRAGSRLRAIGQVTGQFSSVMQQLEPTVTDDTIDI
jgi:hypothetical protein